LLGAVILFAVRLSRRRHLALGQHTKILGISAMIPLILIGVVPILTGDIVKANSSRWCPWPTTPWAMLSAAS